MLQNNMFTKTKLSYLSTKIHIKYSLTALIEQTLSTEIVPNTTKTYPTTKTHITDMPIALTKHTLTTL